MTSIKLDYKTRGHFCNYWRKVLENKCMRYKSHTANSLIWYAWKEESARLDILTRLHALPVTDDAKTFNQLLGAIAADYETKPGFGQK